MPDCIVIGGGLAGMSAALALASAGYQVELWESRPFLGGRATSFPYIAANGEQELIDNCQHILLRCCVNLLDFYRRLGAQNEIRFYREFTFLEPGGRRSRMASGVLPAPGHFAGSFLTLRFLSLADKLAVARGLLALLRERNHRTDLDDLTMADWLAGHGQTPNAVNRFWRPILVSAVNEELERMAARYGFQVFWLGFLARRDAYEMGVPNVRLGELYAERRWERFANVTLRLRAPVERVVTDGRRVRAVIARGVEHRADFYISAVPFERFTALGVGLPLECSAFQHSPITSIHLWFDRSVTALPHAALLDRTIQWFFNKRDGRYLQLVVSASRALAAQPREEIIRMALAELSEFLPGVRGARLEKAHVVKEMRATFSAAPGLESRRPRAETALENFFLAGDWTATGWPSTMEGAVRSGYRAAEAVTLAAGAARRFVLPDIA
jgi:zeta-carotene desaturase